MKFEWLKRFMPRGLYGRAALILVVPVITLQLGVSTVFIQRHFEDVTLQLTGSVALELNHLHKVVDAAPDLGSAQGVAKEIGQSLEMDVTLPSTRLMHDRRSLFDLTGNVVQGALYADVAGLEGVDLRRDRRRVMLTMGTTKGPMEVSFHRRRVSASNPHQLLVLMVLLGALMTAVAYVYLRNQLRPIKRLASASEAFGKGRHVPYRPAGATEVRAAGSAFLDMRARIERQIEQRTLMLSGVSHDLRTPLTRLKLGLSMLEDETEAAEMTRDVEEMERLVDEFLAFVRGDALDDPETADPVALARAAVERATRAGGAVTMGEVQGTGTAKLRPMAIGRALDNLIGNAMRYGNNAVVSVAVLDRSIRFSVEDDGPGIAAADRDQAVQPFVRLDVARNQNRGSGVGLGLAIANDIARRHGGSLTMGDSPALGGLKADLILAR